MKWEVYIKYFCWILKYDGYLQESTGVIVSVVSWTNRFCEMPFLLERMTDEQMVVI